MSPPNSSDMSNQRMTFCGTSFLVPRTHDEREHLLFALVYKLDEDNTELQKRVAALENKLSKLISQTKGQDDVDCDRDSAIAFLNHFVTQLTADSPNQPATSSALADSKSPTSSTTTLASTSSTGAPVLNVAIPATGSLSASASPSPASECAAPAVAAPRKQKPSTLFTAEDQAAFPAGPYNMPACMVAEPFGREAAGDGLATEKDREKVLKRTPASAWITVEEMGAIMKKGVMTKNTLKVEVVGKKV